MLIRGFLLKYAAGLFILFLILLAAGIAVYTIWFAPPREAPRRSRPVAVLLNPESCCSGDVYIKLHYKGACCYDHCC